MKESKSLTNFPLQSNKIFVKINEAKLWYIVDMSEGKQCQM